jgi:dienelactone hydrolase
MMEPSVSSSGRAAVRGLSRVVVVTVMVAGLAGAAAAQSTAGNPSGPPRVSATRVAAYSPPSGVAFRTVPVISEGVRLNAEVFSPQAAGSGPLPTVIQANGWGGVAAVLRDDAVALARAGYLVIDFDYRGWGLSDGRLVLAGNPDAAAGRRLTAPVEELREYIDPIEQTVDWLSVVNWAMGEPAVDRERVGLRGTSYSGGHVVFVAGRDSRVKVIVSQVGGFGSNWVMTPGAMRDTTWREATERARGELGYPEPGARVVGNLRGAPIRDKLALYAPLDEAPKLTHCAALFIVAEHDELVHNDLGAHRAFELMPDPRKDYVVIPNITHFGIYKEGRQEAITRAIAWFDRYLKP